MVSLGLALGSGLGIGLALPLALAQSLAFSLAVALALSLALSPALALAFALALALSLSPWLGPYPWALARALALASALAGVPILTRRGRQTVNLVTAWGTPRARVPLEIKEYRTHAAHHTQPWYRRFLNIHGARVYIYSFPFLCFSFIPAC